MIRITVVGVVVALMASVLPAAEPYIFDWSIRHQIETGFEQYTPIAHPGHDGPANAAVYTNLYSTLDAQNRTIGLMLQPDTNPIDGSADANALATSMSLVPRLNMVWADLEGANRDAEMLEVIRQVRAHSNPLINSAYVGNYADFPGATDTSDPYPERSDRSARHDFYMSSGTNIANPSIYPYEYNEIHARTAIWGANASPNVRSAMFWAPLERLSVAKRNLPAWHLLIPWVARKIDFPDAAGYFADAPPREDVKALIQHIRLRGADGYYRLGSIVSDDPSFVFDPVENEQNRQDMLDAWQSLDAVFDQPGMPEILNLATNKTQGLEWSGVRVGSKVAIMISNLGGLTRRVNLPDISGLPDYSDYVPSGQHLLTIYTVAPEPATAMIPAVILGLIECSRRRRLAPQNGQLA